MFGLSRQQQQQEGELYAFDLTWRNYLPSTSQLCACFPFTGQGQGILLADDDDNDNNGDNTDQILCYNDIYQAKAVRGYLEDQLDREFDDLLLPTDELRDPQTPVWMAAANQQQEQASSSDEQESIFSDHHLIKDSGVYTPPDSIPCSDSSSIVTSHESAVHPILNERLDDLTEKLDFIRNNMVMMMDSNAASLKMDDEPVHPPTKPPKRSHDMVPHYLRKASIVSTTSSHDYTHRRLSYGLAPDLCLHGLESDYTYYFNEDDDDEDDDDEHGSFIQDAVFSFGKRWLGQVGFP